jgi:hypothetical protein
MGGSQSQGAISDSEQRSLQFEASTKGREQPLAGDKDAEKVSDNEFSDLLLDSDACRIKRKRPAEILFATLCRGRIRSLKLAKMRYRS